MSDDNLKQRCARLCLRIFTLPEERCWWGSQITDEMAAPKASIIGCWFPGRGPRHSIPYGISRSRNAPLAGNEGTAAGSRGQRN